MSLSLSLCFGLQAQNEGTAGTAGAPDGVTFEDVAVGFSLEEWSLLEGSQKDLHQEVMLEMCSLLRSLGEPIRFGTEPRGSASPFFLARIWWGGRLFFCPEYFEACILSWEGKGFRPLTPPPDSNLSWAIQVLGGAVVLRLVSSLHRFESSGGFFCKFRLSGVSSLRRSFGAHRQFLFLDPPIRRDRREPQTQLGKTPAFCRGHERTLQPAAGQGRGASSCSERRGR